MVSMQHPIALLSKDQIRKLYNIHTGDAVVDKSRDDVVARATADLKNPPKAFKEVRVWFNPTAKDMLSWPADRIAAYRKEVAYNESLVKSGAVGGNLSFSNEGGRCYLHTLAFLITKNQAFATKVFDIVRAWSNTCKTFGLIGENGPLEAGWGLTCMANSMEIMRSVRGIPPDVHPAFVAFVKNVLMPQLVSHDQNGIIVGFPAKGNWGCTFIGARLCAAIYIGDQDEVDRCLANAKLMFNNLFVGHDGQEVETTRDLTHTQMGLGGMIFFCEVFYNMGIDIYSTNDNILLKSLEFHASIILGEPVPPNLVGQFVDPQHQFRSANWDVAYNHFVNIKRMAMPKTKAMLEKHRPENQMFQSGYGTLTHWGTSMVK